jgi:hypothetical protein
MGEATLTIRFPNPAVLTIIKDHAAEWGLTPEEYAFAVLVGNIRRLTHQQLRLARRSEQAVSGVGDQAPGGDESVGAT